MMAVACEFLLADLELLTTALSVRAVVYQPQYFPRLHYFARVLASHVFWIADDVQFVRKHAYHMPDGSAQNGPSYQAHTPIKTRNGRLLLDYPTENKTFRSIRETPIRYGARDDKGKHVRIIAQEYRKAPHFKRIAPTLDELFGRDFRTVADLNIASIRWGLAQLFECEPEAVVDGARESGFMLARIARSSESGVPISDKASGRDANDWLVDLCAAVGADEYHFGGTGAAAYMDFSKFDRAGIRLVEQRWDGRSYPQLHGDFIPNLSIIDLLMNVSPAEARDILHARSA